jgi:hypothetical protein
MHCAPSGTNMGKKAGELGGAGFFPVERGKFEVGEGEVGFGVGGGAFFALVDVVDGLGRGDPGFGDGVVDGGLDALGVVFGEEAQVFVSYADFGPDTLIEHSGAPKS